MNECLSVCVCTHMYAYIMATVYNYYYVAMLCFDCACVYLALQLYCIHLAMKMSVLFIVTLMLLLCITTCDVYNVIPDDDYSNTTCHHCHTLRYYQLNTTKYFTSNSQFLFFPGLHHLHSDLIIENVDNI